MPKFNKTNITADDLIVVLKRKGLSIADEAKSINYIRNIGYYRLKAYFYPLYQEPKHKHLFYGSLHALGIGAASFWSGAEKDIAESPTAIAGTPKDNS